MTRPPSIRLVALASLVGTAIEWYDFYLYGTAAALIFNRLYFPTFDPLTGTLAAFGTYAAGFVARPIGGIIVGHYGDRVGRKSMLVLTLVIMGLATFGIGLLPTYAQIGPWAAVGLVTLRLAQGFGVGGEWGGAVLMAVEHAPPGSRGFYGSWPQMGVPAGLLLSSFVFVLLSRLPEDQFLSWGWRLPFLLSILLVGVGLVIRLRILETPAFLKVKETGAEVQAPDRRSPPNSPTGSAARHRGAAGGERGVLHLLRVPARVRHAESRTRPADAADRHPARCGLPARRGPGLRLAVRSAREKAGVSVRRLFHRGVGVSVVQVGRHGIDTARVARAWSLRSCSDTRRCTARRRRSSPSCLVRAFATAARRSDPSSRPSLRAASRRLLRRRCCRTAVARWRPTSSGWPS